MVGFQAAQCSSSGGRLGDAVAAAHTFELALAHDLHRHPDLAVVRPLRRTERAWKAGLEPKVNT